VVLYNFIINDNIIIIIIIGILDDLQAQVESQCQQIQKDADFMATSIKQGKLFIHIFLLLLLMLKLWI